MNRTFAYHLTVVLLAGALVGFGITSGCAPAKQPAWETGNPVKPLPAPPLGIDSTFEELEDPPTPETVRLGRWLFYDTRLSADDTVSCATCHRPEHAFSEPTPVSTGIDGQQGTRKAPSFVNLAWPIYPHFFWDGRAASLEEQAKGPIVNPLEMGMESHDLAIERIRAVSGYAPYFEEAFGDAEITIDRVAKAIADYERTRMSGNSPYDRWQAGDESALSKEAKLGVDLFFDKAKCNQCHLGQNFTDNRFHNLGIGWDAEKKEFADVGRYEVSGEMEDMGAFKTPGLRECSKHAPYMHDGSIETLEEVMIHYNVGSIDNPYLSPKIEPLDLSTEEVEALLAFMIALDGEGYQDTAPETFPQ
jgi:cytochrome c peroxidase